ncbi:MAG: hypothetical protein JSS65_00590 [Armatimonadetes bacterium]|nr:hypothetical protein [Armatimonadota bacterium]
MPVYVGLDAGGTKTRLRAEDEAGNILAEAVAGPANLATTPEPAWQAALAELAAQCPPADFVAGCFAGLLTKADEERAITALRRHFPTAQHAAWPDYAATVAAAPEGTTAVVIAGTGSVIASMVDGKIVKSGGGGPLLGDGGSAFDVGRSCIRKMLLGPKRLPVSEPTWKAIEMAFGTRDPEEIVAAIYRHPNPVAALASLAPAFFEEARCKSRVGSTAISTVAFQAINCADHVEVHFPNLRNWQIVLAGGVWKSYERVAMEYEEDLKLMAIGPRKKNKYRFHKVKVEVKILDPDPVDGAVILARKLAMPETP